jgi:hypothetical protein
VTRPGRSSRDVVALFDSDRYAAVVRIVQEAEAAVSATDIMATLRAAGATIDARAWDPLQRRLRADEHIVVESGFRYRWVAQPDMAAPDAFERIARAAGRRTSPALLDSVRRALDDVVDPRETDAQQRQATLDGVRALAELASEVEELAANDASARALVHRVRSRVRLSGLEPIERAGDQVAFDRRRHEPIGAPIAAGATVTVVRPGYTWKSPDEEVLVAKAVVQE